MLSFKPQKGFILWIVLGFFTALSLFISSSLQHILIYNQVLKKWELNHQNFYQLEYALRMVMQNPVQKNCLVLSEDEVLPKILNKQSCKLNIAKKEYQFIVEDLGVFSCLIDKNQKATQHFRISMQVSDEKNSNPVLQVRWIKASNKNEHCREKKKIIKTGISSWRYFSFKSKTLTFTHKT